MEYTVKQLSDLAGVTPRALRWYDKEGLLPPALILTVQKTMNSEQGGSTMSDQEKFEDFKQKLIRENEETYGAEARGKYGDEAMDRANARLAGMTQEQYWAMTALEDDIRRKLTAAILAHIA